MNFKFFLPASGPWKTPCTETLTGAQDGTAQHTPRRGPDHEVLVGAPEEGQGVAIALFRIGHDLGICVEPI